MSEANTQAEFQYTLEPLGERVVVLPVEDETKARAERIGLITETMREDRPHHGTVMAVGPGVTDDSGKYRETVVKPGEIVYWGRNSGVELEMPDTNKTKIFVIRESDIIGRIVKKPKVQKRRI